MKKRGRQPGVKLPYEKQKFYVIYDKNDNIRQCGTAQQLVDEGKYSSLNSFHSAIKHIKDYNNGTKDVCSFLYSRAARIAKEMGYEKIITYILCTESGTSLKASGWIEEGTTSGGHWSRPSRPRKTTAPTVPKKRFAKYLR